MASAGGGSGGAALGRTGSAALGSGCGYGDGRRAAGAADLASRQPQRRREWSATWSVAADLLPPESGGGRGGGPQRIWRRRGCLDLEAAGVGVAGGSGGGRRRNQGDRRRERSMTMWAATWSAAAGLRPPRSGGVGGRRRNWAAGRRERPAS
uniref:Uncharacterized protein n=1 Tax=Oryza sativa subsp. japonica TaxID=39947 RepID=Q6ER43_ORYSJ|nr:hypothetical protein [Oryza sativa Japonica Group]